MDKDKTGVRELSKVSTEAFVAKAHSLAPTDEVTSTATDNAGGKSQAISINWNEAILLPVDGENGGEDTQVACSPGFLVPS